MAEVNTGGGNKKGRRKTVSTKIDMTPMVDLAFLLITFFMLTTTFSKPQTMEVNMPDKTNTEEKQPLKESKALTILLAEDDKIYWFSGITNPKVELTNYTAEGIRKVLQVKNKQVSDLVVLIKAKDGSKYKNIVDILDEMHVTNTKRYAIVDFTPADEELIKNI
jgi:biopolymer transport protein ExbD